MQENKKYKVIAVEDAGVYEGNSVYNYTILEKATGKTCVLEECMLLDMDVFCEDDFAMLLAEQA